MEATNIRLYRTGFVGFYKVRFEIDGHDFESTAVHRRNEIAKTFKLTTQVVDELVKAIQ